MAKIFGFGAPPGFVERMQKQALFGYELAGTAEGQFSPYVPYRSLGAAQNAGGPDALLQCPGGESPVWDGQGDPNDQNDPNNWRCAPSTMQCPGGQVPRGNPSNPDDWTCPPSVMACPDGSPAEMIGGVWACKGTAPIHGKNEQFMLAIWARASGYPYGQSCSNSVDGVWGTGSKAAYAEFAKRQGIPLSNDVGVLNALYAFTRAAPAMNDAKAGAALLDDINCKKAPVPQPQPQACPSGTSGTYPNCVADKPPPNWANIIIGGSLIAAAVGLLAFGAKRRDEA